MRKVTNEEIRDWLGHNGRECKVKISRNGEVWRYGSPEPTDRSKDHWIYLGRRGDFAADILYKEAMLKIYS